MTETNPAAGSPGHARLCSACGGPLLVPTARCPRCGAVITAQGRARRSRSVVVIVVVAVALLGALPCMGIVAAIAIPNFLRYQLRSKEAAARMELQELVLAEKGTALKGGRYVALGPLPSGRPGARKLQLSAADLQIAEGIDWNLQPATHGQFRVAVAEDSSGRQAASFCMETDLDGDGSRAVHVEFLPLESGAPPAPCTTPVPYDPQYRADEVIRISARSVF
jgi:hypothetical protein